MKEEWDEKLPWCGQYVLDENGDAVPATGLLDWARWMEAHERHVAQNQIGNARVSTVFLGIDYGPIFMMGREGFDPTTYKPVLWETMVFGGPYDMYQMRYTSRQAAQEGHGKIVQMLTS